MKEEKKDRQAVIPVGLSRRKLLTYAAPVGVALSTLAPHTAEASGPALPHSIQPGQSVWPGKGEAALVPETPGTVLASAMWIQGNALTVENPAAVAQTVHIGWGTVVYGVSGQSSWFHIPIPSPVIINGARPQLAKVFLMFDIGVGSGYITNVHLYDGAYNFKQFNGLSLSGDHRTFLDGYNTFVLGTPQTIYLALGISFAFQFSACIDGGCSSPWFTISSAGGDFQL